MIIEEKPRQQETPAKPAYKVIGTRPVRPDGVEKVIGRAKYGADIDLPGMLYGKVLRSPVAHAYIRSIDTSAAEKLPGVKAVVTSADLPRLSSNEYIDMGEGGGQLQDLHDNILASRKVLYKGHAIASVAATNPHIAEEALSLIKLDIEELPPVLDPLEAMREDAPLLDDQRYTESLAGRSSKPSNIARHAQHAIGDIEAGFAQADVIVEREYRTSMVHQGYIEPQNGTALWDADDHITVWTSTQGAFSVRAELSKLLLVPLAQIRVIPMEIGGGFGGKIAVYLEPVAALLSRKAGRPVKMTMTRAEVLEATGPTSGTYIKLKMGAKKDGRLIAAQAYMVYESGAYPSSPLGAGMSCMLGPYDIPNVLIDGYDVVVNKPRTAAYRAPGAPAAAFAAESLVDELAGKVGLDPLTFRRINASKLGTRLANGNVLPRVGNYECITAAMESEHWNAPLSAPWRGRGVASGVWYNWGGLSSLTASVNADGSVTLTEGSTDIGGSRATAAMQLAEALGIPYESIHPFVADTDNIGYNDVTGGSRTTFATGWAVYEAAQQIKRQLIERAARLWECSETDVDYTNGVLTCKTNPDLRLSFKEMAEKAHSTGGTIVGCGNPSPKQFGPAFATHIVDVEVDPETGKVQILRYTAIQDVGTAIHPSYVEGQIQGGVAQGVGWALNEVYDYDEQGRLRNASLLDYRQPTTLDLPMIDTILVEVPNPTHPYGVRGVGEVPIVPPLAAVANAIAHATGHRFLKLPLNPDAVLRGLGKIK
ncbi:MAG: xanthine dehydrogenase family protein molybdopterin-binding subunit [Chloroflexi bacterium]|nr:xanthine dehydrogenase family protein molybdopterin-binding subunit [Chloroflexota bacterium]